jgi:hypothetical protein
MRLLRHVHAHKRLLKKTTMATLAPTAPTANGGAFLRPDATKQAELRKKADEKLRAKKAKDKVDAAERKRKREKDKERIAAIEEEIVANKAKREASATTPSESPFKAAVVAARQSPEDAERDERCNAYLDEREMLGHSSFDAKDLIKDLCGDGTRVFNMQRKLWGTTSHERLEALIRTCLWQPFAMEPEWNERLIELAKQRTEALHRKTEATLMVKREDSMAVSPEETKRIADERERGKRAALMREWYTPPTEQDQARVKALGLDDSKFLDKTQGLIELGPIVGLSAEARVMRWVDFQVGDARFVYERDPRYWDDEFMSTVEENGRTGAVANLKKMVGALAAV